MKLYNNLSEFTPPENVVLTCGTFDGIHKGHMKLLERITSIAKETGGESVLLTFWPHPKIVLDPDFHLQLLSTFEEKTALLKKVGIAHLVCVPFSREFSNLSPEEYIKDIIVDKLGTKIIVIGYDHRFGKNRAGGLSDLIKLSGPMGFKVEEISRQEIDDIVVSSTMIRKHLSQGEIHIGNEYLGHEFEISGIVIRGDQRGRKIGFPTANIRVSSEHKLIPSDGSYAVRVKLNGEILSGMINIGFRPTINGKQRSIEVNIFEFDQDIYGNQITIYFVKLIRKEIKFDNIEKLKHQLTKDKQTALELLRIT